MKRLLIFILLLFSVPVLAQQDVIPAKKSAVTVSPVMHGSLVLQWNGRTIYVDPYNGADKFADFPAPDLVLITDIHGDHLHKETLKALDLSNAELVAPQAVMDELGNEINFKKKHTLANDEEMKWRSISIKAMPMYNLPENEEARHVKGRGNGYILTMGKQRFYLAGDTEAIPEMRQLENIDVAFIPMNLPFTMDVQQAADGVLDFKPRIVYPYHFRGAEGKLSDVEQFKALVNMKDPSIDVRLRDWYPEK
ncbi:MBL fold metallo-hydrolase [Cesiribacter sp. SM1]|uniref:MBL fold metallo-hydrolase n=1 Tax=Cesiribacter sp. SM1 TaxID=2861196 RepID=UPI001CD7CA6D|nr:MBL fold metallo-hydrolase [Cesiribacter sp. SM1]